MNSNINSAGSRLSHRMTAATASCLFCLLLTATHALAQQGYAVGDRKDDKTPIQFFQLAAATDPNKWTPVGQPSLKDEDAKKVKNLKGVTITPDKRAYVVGSQADGSGLILYKESSTWQIQKIKDSPKNTISAISFTGDQGLAVGDKGTVLYSNGYDVEWTPVESDIKNLSDMTLSGVCYLNHTKLGRRAWIAGNKGLLYYADGKLQSTGVTGSVTAVDGFTNPESKQGKPPLLVVAAGSSGIWWWAYPNLGDRFSQFTKKNLTKGDLPPGTVTAVSVVSPFEFWIGIRGDKNVYRFTRRRPDETKFTLENFSYDGGNFDTLTGLSVRGQQVWITNSDGKIAYSPLSKKNWTLVPWDDATPKQLNGIRVVPEAKKIKQDEVSSPDYGSPGITFVAVGATDFPAGDITPANVVLAFGRDCRGGTISSARATSVVSGDGDSKLISFLLPSGVDPGQYYISISDYAEGDATFESSNCSVMNVVQ